MMTTRTRTLSFLSATCLLAGSLWAASPAPPTPTTPTTPTVPTVPATPPTPTPQAPTTPTPATPTSPAQTAASPAWAGLTTCDYRATGEICCAGHLDGMGSQDMVIRIDGAAYCPAATGAKVVPITGDVTVKATKPAVDFTGACTVPDATMDCPVVSDLVLV